eukprot:6213412-Pleurochrysis_carterae.AAC.4
MEHMPAGDCACCPGGSGRTGSEGGGRLRAPLRRVHACVGRGMGERRRVDPELIHIAKYIPGKHVHMCTCKHTRSEPK